MQLTLKRWEDSGFPGQGSRGFWLIEELPGFYVIKEFDQWYIECNQPKPDGETGSQEDNQKTYQQMEPVEQRLHEVWGRDYRPYTEVYRALPARLREGFRTRREAVEALAAAVTEPPRPAISEIIGGAA